MRCRRILPAGAPSDAAIVSEVKPPRMRGTYVIAILNYVRGWPGDPSREWCRTWTHPGAWGGYFNETRLDVIITAPPESAVQGCGIGK